MPNTRSALKRTRSSAAKAVKNTAKKSALRTALKKCRMEINANSENCADIIKATSRQLDKAAAAGIIHKNTAARRKSRLAKAAKIATA